jgi:hypothetical protein
MNTAKETSGASHEDLSPVHQLTHDEVEVIEAYRRAKRMAYADIAITIQEGKRVKLWLTEKKK